GGKGAFASFFGVRRFSAAFCFMTSPGAHAAQRNKSKAAEKRRTPNVAPERKATTENAWFFSAYVQTYFGGADFEKCAAVFEEVFADGAGPEHTDKEGKGLRVLGRRQVHANFMTQQPLGADQAHARRRQIAAQQCELPAVFGLHLHRLDKIDALLDPAFLTRRAGVILLDQPANGTLNRLLLALFLLEAWTDRGDVIITALAVVQRFPRQGGDLFPLLLGKARQRQFGANIAGHHEPLTLRASDDGTGDVLQCGGHFGSLGRAPKFSILSRAQKKSTRVREFCAAANP